jgi:hypothetical protein
MDKTYEEGYREGFKDGWNESRKLPTTLPKIPTHPGPFIPNTWPYSPNTADAAKCPVCGNLYSNMTHYVCSNQHCPSNVKVTLTTMNLTED